jgi:hypothetical protein
VTGIGAGQEARGAEVLGVRQVMQITMTAMSTEKHVYALTWRLRV